MVLLLLANLIEGVLKVALDYIDRYSGLLLLLCLALLLLAFCVVSNDPETHFTEQWLDVLLQSLHEVGMIKVKHLLNKVTTEDTEHPDLLVLKETGCSLVEAVTAKSMREARFHVVNICLMKSNYLLLVVFCDHCVWALCLKEDRGKNIEVIYEELVELIKEADTFSNCLLKVIVALLDVLISPLFMLMKLTKLVARLPIAQLRCLSKEIKGLVKILGNSDG
jgi:hypothetical protein